MADQTPPQTPPAPAQPPQSAPPAPSPVVQAVEGGFKTAVSDLWSKYGILFIIVGALILAAKFGDVIMDILGWSSKKDLEKAEATDATLKAQADAANAQADALVKQANDLPKQEGQVSDDWDKKKS